MSHHIIIGNLIKLPVGFIPIITPHPEIPLNLTLLDCGHDIVKDNSYRVAGHTRSSFESIIQLTLGGEGHLRYEDQDYKVGADEIMLLNTGHDYHYNWNGKDNWEFVFLTMMGGETRRLVWEIIGRNGPVFKITPFEQELLLKILTPVYNNEINEFEISADIYNFLMSVMSRTLYGQQRTRLPRKLIRGIAFCKENFHNPAVGMDDIARVSCLSRSQVFRIFKTYTGVTPGRYLERVRLETAKKMLQETTMTVEELSEKCGFSTPGYFCKVFKNRTGLTPSQYRRGDL